MWVPQIWTQILLFVQQLLMPTESFPEPLNYFFLYFTCEEKSHIILFILRLASLKWWFPLQSFSGKWHFSPLLFLYDFLYCACGWVFLYACGRLHSFYDLTFVKHHEKHESISVVWCFSLFFSHNTTKLYNVFYGISILMSIWLHWFTILPLLSVLRVSSPFSSLPTFDGYLVLAILHSFDLNFPEDEK